MNRLLNLIDRIFPPKRYHHRQNGPVTINPDVREQIHVWGSSKGQTVTTETTARDELAREIFIADNNGQPRDASLKDWEAYGFGKDATYAHNIAEGLLAAGYSKPRTITTSRDLGALPLGSVVLDSTHTTRTYVASADGERYYADCYGEDGELTLPATVLHEPTPGGAE